MIFWTATIQNVKFQSTERSPGLSSLPGSRFGDRAARYPLPGHQPRHRHPSHGARPRRSPRRRRGGRGMHHETAVERFTTPRLTTVPHVVAAMDSRAWDLPMQTTSKWLGTAQTAPRLARPGGSGSVRACGRCLPCSAWMSPTGAAKAWLAPQGGTPSVERGSLARVEFRVVVPTEGAASLNGEVRTSVHGEGYPSLVI